MENNPQKHKFAFSWQRLNLSNFKPWQLAKCMQSVKTMYTLSPWSLNFPLTACIHITMQIAVMTMERNGTGENIEQLLTREQESPQHSTEVASLHGVSLVELTIISEAVDFTPMIIRHTVTLSSAVGSCTCIVQKWGKCGCIGALSSLTTLPACQVKCLRRATGHSR